MFENGTPGEVEAWLEGGGDPSIRDEQGSSALHLAAYGGKLDFVQALVKVSRKEETRKFPKGVQRERDRKCVRVNEEEIRERNNTWMSLTSLARGRA